ncbi:hypothetical protein LXL04_023660 [Taraxacum kok-saghyz]
MLHRDPDTKALQAQQTIDHINQQIQKYQQQKNFPVTTPPNTPKVNTTKEDIIKNFRLYCCQLKQDLSRIQSKETGEGEAEDSNEDSIIITLQIAFKLLTLLINYKPLNKVLKWIRYPIPYKKDLLDRLHDAIIFSKFDLKSGYWQIQVTESDRYKTAFNGPFAQYEWNVMPIGVKNAPSEFQNIMNDIFYPYSNSIIVYIDHILVFYKILNNIFIILIYLNK